MNARPLRLFAALLVIGVALAACGQSPAQTAPPAAKYPRTVTDSFGARTTIKSAGKVVAMTDSVSDPIFAMGEGARVVGRDKYSAWPPGEIDKIPAVGSYSAINVEGLLSLGADLLIVPDWAARLEKNTGVLNQLRSSGVGVLVVPERTRAERLGQYTPQVLEEVIGVVADAMGVPDKGKELVARMRADVAAASAAAQRCSTKPRVLGLLPYTPGSTRVSGALQPDDLAIRLAGGVNLSAEAGVMQEKEITSEEIIKLAPDIIVIPEKIAAQTSDLADYILRTPGVAATPAGAAKRFLTWPDGPSHRATWRLPRVATELAGKMCGKSS